jgi:uncharacterized protein YjiS (DUF1127 family)
MPQAIPFDSGRELARAERPASAPFGRLLGLAGEFIARRRRAAEDRRLRPRLAELSDTLLLDIGIAEDEIYRIRAYERFTPRAWHDRGRRCGA